VEPGTVTCCFTARQTVLNVYINSVDVTAQVQGDLTRMGEAKTITFPEPTVRDAALAFKTEEREQGVPGSLMAQCTSDRAESPWNALTTADPSAWLGVWTKQDGTFFQSDWYKNYYNWGEANNGLKPVDDTYSLKTNMCGAKLDTTDKVSHVFYSVSCDEASSNLTSISCTIVTSSDITYMLRYAFEFSSHFDDLLSSTSLMV
jgi:hypothetical protein